MANEIHTYVRQDTTPDDDRDNLRDRKQRDRELESFAHDEDQPENVYDNDFEKAPEQTELTHGQTMRDTLHQDLSGDASKSVPARERSYTFGKRKKKTKERGRGRSHGIENGRVR